MIWGAAFHGIKCSKPSWLQIPLWPSSTSQHHYSRRASVRASLDSIRSWGYSWPSDIPACTPTVLGLLGSASIHSICDAGDKGLVHAKQDSSNWATSIVPVHWISWRWRIIVTCFMTYLKHTKKKKKNEVTINVVVLERPPKSQMDTAPTWSSCSLPSLLPYSLVLPT